jgi:hypothetical protein
MNAPKLASAYSQNKAVKAICEHMAARERNQNETKLERVLRLLTLEGSDFKKTEVIAAFRQLEDAECGRYVEGRRGWSSRFVWEVKSLLVADAAKGKSSSIQDASSDPRSPDSSDDDLIEHVFVLRPDLPVTLDLPEDLTAAEAERLAAFVKALPFGSDS